PREHDGLPALELDHAWEGNQLLHIEIIARALAIFECAVLAPDMPRFAGYPGVGRKIPGRYRQDVTINIAHGLSIRGGFYPKDESAGADPTEDRSFLTSFVCVEASPLA